jgi:hypothetical protein
VPDRIRLERAPRVERTFRHDALPFAEQVRQHALIADGNVPLAVGHFEPHRKIIAVHQRAVLDQPAKPDSRPPPDVLLHDVARRIEEHDRIAKRVEHQRSRDGQHAEAAADQNEAPLLASHDGRLGRMRNYPSSRRVTTG